MVSIESPAEQIENLKRKVRELEELLVSSVSADTVVIMPQRGDFGEIAKYLWDKKIPHNLKGYEFIEVPRIAYERLKKDGFDVRQYSREEINRICDEKIRLK